MAFDSTRYQPPGVYTERTPGPQLAILSEAPTAIGLFGLTVGRRSDTQTFVVSQDADSTTPGGNERLRQPGVRTNSIVVRNPDTGETYTVNEDFKITPINVDDSITTATPRDDVYMIQRIIGGRIQPGDRLAVSYEYVNNDYFDVYHFYDYDDVRDAYGEPFDALGNIQSELSLAAKFAFMNGAQTLACVAVDPVNPASVTLNDYQQALDKLRDVSTISIVVPANGQQNIQQLVRSHVELQSNTGYERRAIMGRDGSIVPVPSSTRIADAQNNSSRRVALVSPATVKYYAPELNREIVLGSQYLAAAVAGISVSNSPARPLTRRVVNGFTDVGDQLKEPQKNQESQRGLMVVEKTRRGALQIRHGVTTATGTITDREWSVTGQEDTMVFRLREYLSGDGLIGEIIDDLTLINVKASVESALSSLTRDRVIRAHQNLKVRQLVDNPDVVEIRYEWQASMPLNYIVVKYSLSVTEGELTGAGQ